MKQLQPLSRCAFNEENNQVSRMQIAALEEMKLDTEVHLRTTNIALSCIHRNWIA